MKRNKFFAKEILEFIVREDELGGGLYRSEILAVFAETYPNQNPAGLYDALSYHLNLLLSAGFVTVTSSDHDEENVQITWAGHDYIEASN
ncbi:hypothetical protein [Pseudomonas sp. RIT-To-2]|uniref:hypothetical protein n=1 Tax=Pseudomonas sp. RIT-To-2 TaxID=3462541 RepID=UPI002413AC96